ncbi:hypothetical protein SK128_019539, partial [Halocaridina rubra]
LPLPFTTSPSNEKDIVLSDFRDVLVLKTDLQAVLIKKMVGCLMNINLKDDAVPI